MGHSKGDGLQLKEYADVIHLILGGMIRFHKYWPHDFIKEVSPAVAAKLRRAGLNFVADIYSMVF